MLWSAMAEWNGSSLRGNVTGGFQEILWQLERTLSESFTGNISSQEAITTRTSPFPADTNYYQDKDGVSYCHIFPSLWTRFGRIQTFVPGPFSLNRCLAWPFKHPVSIHQAEERSQKSIHLKEHPSQNGGFHTNKKIPFCPLFLF